MKQTILVWILFLTSCTALWAQDGTTNAFDDLRRTGRVNEEDSEMRIKASPEALEHLLNQSPKPGYFCFTEDRQHEIRMRDAIPACWTERSIESRHQLKGSCAPGEFYTWQIGLFTPFKKLNNVSISFADLKNERGERIPKSALRCFNLGGVDWYGEPFRKTVHVEKGEVQALWIGVAVPATASGSYRGTVTLHAVDEQPVPVLFELTVEGPVIKNQGDDEGWRKTRLRWLDETIGNTEEPTAPYTPIKRQNRLLSWLGGEMQLSHTGLPMRIATRYDRANQLDASAYNPILADEMQLVIETALGEEVLKSGTVQITKLTDASAAWTVVRKNRNFEVTCSGKLSFDGLTEYRIAVKARNQIHLKDIRLEVPYTAYAAKYLMGLGRKGGTRPDSLIQWGWNVDKHQDKIWMGNVNAGLNFCFKDENYVRPLVNIYYQLGKLNLPCSWGNEQKGGIRIQAERENRVWLQAYSGERTMDQGEVLNYNFSMLVTPVKPLDLATLAEKRFYHPNSDVSADYIPEALRAGANSINVHHKKDIYPYINYPFSDESVPDLKQFIEDAHQKQVDVRLYYTTRELTVKIPELWALRSLGDEIIHDGPGKDARTLIHRNGPHEWLTKNLTTNFIPAWYNAFNRGKYAGEMDLSVITTPDSRWNNYYLAGLDWMIKNLGVDGVYIDDSALDRKTLQRARRILDADGKRRLVDIHSWNHMNEWAGYANSLHLYLELLPYVDRTWIGEGFNANNSTDFWLVEMSGIPFGLMSETLEAQNLFRGMIFGMLPRLPWSGNPVPLWQLWDHFGMKEAEMRGYWDERSPVKCDNPNLPVTVYLHGDKALVVVANWTDMPQTGRITLDEKLLGFTPSVCTLPEIKGTQWGKERFRLNSCEVMGRSGLIILLEK